jgi:hypothetical protein
MDENSKTIDLFQKYHEEIATFLKFDEMNMKDTQMSLPSIRHYWVGRLMFHKKEINKLKKQKGIVFKKIKEKIESESPVDLKQTIIVAAVQNHELYQRVEEEIANQELLVEFLSKVEANFRDAQYGLNNLTKIIQLETT